MISFDDQDADRTTEHFDGGASREQGTPPPQRIPGRDFAGAEGAASEREQMAGRDASAETRDNRALGPHDQEFSEDGRVEEGDAPLRPAADPREQAPRRAGNDREGSETGRWE